MTPKPNPNDKVLAAWLGDEPAAGAAGDALTQALDALYAAGPDAGAVRAAAARAQRRLAQAREAEAVGGAEAIFYEVLPNTPIGRVFVAVSRRGLRAVRFGLSERAFVAGLRRQTGLRPVRSAAQAGPAARQVAEYLAGRRRAFEVPLDLEAVSAFQREVLLAACQIPRGQVSTYAEVARRIGRPRAARAVGQALSRNPVPIVVPCHRVLAADGSLRGYLGRSGTATKRRLLAMEGVVA